MQQLTHRVTRRTPRDARTRRPRRPVGTPVHGSPGGRLGRLLEEVKRGDSDWTLPILLGTVTVFVALVLTLVLTIVEVAALLA